MDRIKLMLEKQIELSNVINAELDHLQADYQALYQAFVQETQSKPGVCEEKRIKEATLRAANVVNAANFDLRVINTRLLTDLRSKQDKIISLELENERLRLLVSNQTSSN